MKFYSFRPQRERERVTNVKGRVKNSLKTVFKFTSKIKRGFKCVDSNHQWLETLPLTEATNQRKKNTNKYLKPFEVERGKK